MPSLNRASVAPHGRLNSLQLLRWLLVGLLVLSLSGPLILHPKSFMPNVSDEYVNEAPHVVDAAKLAARNIGTSERTLDKQISVNEKGQQDSSNPSVRIRNLGAPTSTKAPEPAATSPQPNLEKRRINNDGGDSKDNDSDNDVQDEKSRKVTHVDDEDDETGKQKSDDEDENDDHANTGEEITASPSLEKTNSTNVWKNDHDMVHIIYSRFMQHQPNLVKLGMARLELFKTFCFPSISQQTNNQFLWIIRTDPDLHPTLKAGLLDSLQDMSNVAIVGSNEVKKGSVDRGFRNTNAISDITEESLFYGKLELIQSYHEAALKDRTLLETNLDADDGLGLTFVERAQNLTFTRFKELETSEMKADDRKDAWMNLCVGRHFEWQFYSPWDESTSKGSLHLGSTHICVTPGLSWATQPHSKPQFIKQHHLVKKGSPACDDPNQRKAAFLGCWLEIPMPAEDVMAIRARTPTSTGMNRVVMSGSDWNVEEQETDKQSWPMLEPSFAISQILVEGSHKYLSDNLQDLVEENLKGQCTKDHSCSEGIKKKLKSLFFQGGKWQSKHDLVHVVHTVHPPFAVTASKYFAFASMESQLTYEFLWIIYVNDLTDWKFKNQMSKRAGKSPLNILVVRSEGPLSPIVDFRSPEAISIFSNDTLVYGEMSLLESFHQAAQTRTVLETTLCANEAVTKTFVSDLQNATVTTQQNAGDEDDSWYYHCTSEYFEWWPFNPANVNEESETGFWNVASPPVEEKCVEKVGTTRIVGPRAKLPTSHDTLSLEPCRSEEHRKGCVVESGERDGARAMIPGLIKGLSPFTYSTDNLSPDKFSTLVANQKSLRADVVEAFNVYMDKPRVKAVRDNIKKHEPSEQPADSVRKLEASSTKLLTNITITTALDTWENDNDIVHILYSRFMQHQPNLLELGMARLELFKTFCFPTISQQTNKQFLWIIRTDPDLNPIIKAALVESLQDMQNVAVVGSNEVRKGSIDNGFRNRKAIADITPESLFYGNRNLVISFQEATKGRTVLETNLDADDGLGLTYIETTQTLVKRSFEKIQSKNGWMNLCVGRHLEWQFFAPWDENTELGSFELGSTHICVTPGLSWATQENASPSFTVMHHLLKKDTPACKSTSLPHLGCWMEIPVPDPKKDHPMAIRARTPTSTGMNGVKVSGGGGWNPKSRALDAESWLLLEHAFAITEALVKSSHNYLKNHLNDLVAENLMGQCTKDHSCGEGIKKKLKSLFFKGGKWINTYDLVHILHMEVPEKLDLTKLFVGYEPVESQTSYEFLWILYVSENMDKDSMKSLMKKVRKSFLNVVVVPSDQAPITNFRESQTLAGLSSKALLFGEMSLIRDFHQAAQNRTVLETSLRANEAFTKSFLEEVQNVTVAQIDQLDASDWYYQCVSEHVEWRHEEPHGVTTGHGFASIRAPHPSEHCTSRPGTTLITLHEAKIPVGWKKEDSKPCQADDKEARNGCYVESGKRHGARALFPGIVEGDIGFQGSGAELNRLTAQQPQLREELHETFAVERFSMRQMVKTLNENLNKLAR